MHKKNIIIHVISILILSTIGLGISVIYSDYLYNPLENFNSLQVIENTADLEMPAKKPAGTNSRLIEVLKRWAQEEKAMLLLKSGFLAGCGFSGYSDWIHTCPGIEKLNDSVGVFISEDPQIHLAYVKNHIFWPEKLNMEIYGTYEQKSLPAFLNTEDFFYPLASAYTLDGMYFTDADDAEKLIAIFEKYGYDATLVKKAGSPGIGTLFRLLLTDSFMSRALLIAMIGLILGFAYSRFILYKENIGRLWVYHLFGLSKQKILIRIIIIQILMIVLASILFYAILSAGLLYLGAKDRQYIFYAALIVYITLTIIAECSGYLYLCRQFKLKGE